MDKYPIEAAGSVIENSPMFRVTFKQPIDVIKLEDAIIRAFDVYPLFKTKVIFKSEYYLETNDSDLIIKHCKEEERPLVFGSTTNGYPWQICYFENKLTFEWLHGISDGIGVFNFLKQILCNYFEVENKLADKKYLIASGLEPFFDSNEKGIDYSVDPKGFSFKEFPAIKNRGYKTDCYKLVCDTNEILSLAHNCNSSVVPILCILYSKAIRIHLPNTMRNRNVACNVVIDLRRPLNYETMHNCVEYKRITYLDEYDDISFTNLAKKYKEILDNARKSPNIIRIITERVNTFKAYHILPFKFWLKLAVKIIGKILKDIDCNFVITYPGKIELPRKVKNNIENIDFKVWHDFGECIIAAFDYYGKFNINISENFKEKGIIEDFIKLSEDLGIHWTISEVGVFEQAHFEEGGYVNE